MCALPNRPLGDENNLKLANGIRAWRSRPARQKEPPYGVAGNTASNGSDALQDFAPPSMNLASGSTLNTWPLGSGRPWHVGIGGPDEGFESQLGS